MIKTISFINAFWNRVIRDYDELSKTSDHYKYVLPYMLIC